MTRALLVSLLLTVLAAPTARAHSDEEKKDECKEVSLGIAVAAGPSVLFGESQSYRIDEPLTGIAIRGRALALQGTGRSGRFDFHTDIGLEAGLSFYGAKNALSRNRADLELNDWFLLMNAGLHFRGAVVVGELFSLGAYANVGAARRPPVRVLEPRAGENQRETRISATTGLWISGGLIGSFGDLRHEDRTGTGVELAIFFDVFWFASGRDQYVGLTPGVMVMF